MKIVLVDDSAALRSRIGEMITEIEGIEIVGQAEDANEAVWAVEEYQPDAVILDIRMPKGDGILALETIKKNIEAPVIIMLTNYPYEQYRRKCLNSGADYFFSKTTDLNKLLDLLKELVSSNGN